MLQNSFSFDHQKLLLRYAVQIEVWKRKLVKAEERHQAEILEISKQCDNTANKKSEVELELQQLQKRVNEVVLAIDNPFPL